MISLLLCPQHPFEWMKTTAASPDLLFPFKLPDFHPVRFPNSQWGLAALEEERGKNKQYEFLVPRPDVKHDLLRTSSQTLSKLPVENNSHSLFVSPSP